MASASLNSCKSGQTDHSEPDYLSHHSKMQESDRRKYSAPSLSDDSGIYFESSQLLDDTERPSNRSLYHHLDMNGFSEEELLNITFEACDTTGKGEVLASTVVQYLHSVTSHSAGEDKLLILQHMLDPEDQDPSVSRDTFHETMKKWIAQCSQASYQASACRAAVNEDEYAPLLTEAMLTDQNECHCESNDLLSLVAELKHAQRRLSRHNSSLLRTVSQCEEANLQLTLEVSELRSKLTSAQVCVGRARSLAEELDETRRDLRESQERTARVQANSNSLMKANEHLKAHIKIIEEMNEKLLHERNSAEDRLNKLRRTNVNIREELEEMRVLLAVKEREITKKDITLQKLKDTYLEYHRITESLQSDLLRLQEHSEQALLRFDICSSSQLGLKSGGIPNHYSLHHEILKAQPRTSMDENRGPLPEIQPHTCSEKDLQNIVDMIKSADFKQLIHNTQISDWDTYTADLLQGQGDQTSSKHQFLTILKELECPRLPLEQHQEHKLAETNQQMQEAHKAISWWKALRVENKRNCTKQETQEANKDMQERIKFLEAELKVAQLEKEEKAFPVQANKKDAAVETELDRDQNRGEANQQLATEVLDSLRKVEALVEKALQAANFLTEGERRMKERMKAISHRVEKALCRTVETTNHLSALEAQVSTCTLSTDLSARHDEGLIDAGHPIIFSSTKCAGPQPISYSGSLKISSKTNGGLYLYSGAEDNVQEGVSFASVLQSNNNQEASQDAADHTSALNDSCETFLFCVKADISEPASLDSLPVGLLNKQSSPEQNKSSQSKPVAAHGPLPETVLNSACEGLTHHRTRENVAGSEEPSYGSVSLLKSEKNKRNVDLPEEGYPDLISRSEYNEDPSHNLHDSGQIQEESASSESEPSKDIQVLGLLKRGQPSESEHWDQTVKILNFDLREVISQSSGKFQEESETSGRSQDETNRSLKEPQSVPFKAFQTAASAGTLKQDISAVCGEAASRATPSSPSPCYLAVPETNTPFFFPHTRSRPTTAPTMPTLPEEEEDSPEEIDSSSKSPFFIIPVQTKLVNVTIATPAIVLPRQACKQEINPLVKTRPHSPRPRLSRNPSSGPITTVDDDGHVIDLIKDELPELQLSEEDRQKNLELLEEAKKVSDRFLTRRGRRSTCSLSDSPTALSPNQTPGSSPVSSRSSSLSTPPSENTASSSPTSQRLEVPAVVVRDYGEANKFDQESLKKLVELKLPEKRKVSSGTLKPRPTTPATAREFTVSQKDSTETFLSTDRGKKPAQSPVPTKPDSQSPATGVAKPVPRPPMQQAPCTAEIKTIGAFPPLMRAVSWDTVGSLNVRNEGAQGDEGLCFSDTLKSSGNTQKLSKLREEHKLIRNQSICGTKLPDLNETAEQDRDSLSTTTVPVYEESKEKADALPIISDVMLRKLKLHRGLPGCAPPLTEKEVENAFVQLSLAFRNDNYTLETRLKQADRDRNLTEENTEKELEEFKNSLKSTSPLWQNAEQRETYQRLIETVSVLHRLANRLSSRAEMVGAVRQEKRMNKATEVMLQYVENLKRTYEKDHAELMEFKKLANQNSNRSYSGSMETGDDGVPRTSRSMSLTMGKALPRRRVSVAVVPKFNLLNIPGQSPTTAGSVAGPSALPVLCEANSQRSDTSSDPAQQTAAENGKVLLEQEGEGATPTKVSCNLEEIRAEIKAKIEEEAYNKGYQEGLKRLKELQDVKEEEKKVEDKLKESDEITEEDLEIEDRPSSKFEGALEVLDRICPKIFKRNRTLWIMLTLFLALFILVNLINFFSNLYSDHTDTSPANGPNKKFLGLRVGSKNPSRTE